MDQVLINRPLNEGFSGGEKKRNEILQMAVLDPGSHCSTKLIRVSTSTLCAWSPTGSMPCADPIVR